MAVYHVTTLKKLSRYEQTGVILPPVRAWRTVESAERFSKQTGRRVILRLTDGWGWSPLDGHQGEAVVTHRAVPFPRAVQ